MIEAILKYAVAYFCSYRLVQNTNCNKLEQLQKVSDLRKYLD